MGNRNSTTAQKFRANAEEYRRQANATPPPEIRDMLLKLARAWDNLAAEYEKLDKPE